MAVSDFRVYDSTEGWVSMGEVAADKVTLPVPSADGTVVLDSPAADTFTIETGGTERLRVDGNGRVSCQGASTSPYPFYLKQSTTFASPSYLRASPVVNESQTGETSIIYAGTENLTGSPALLIGLATTAPRTGSAAEWRGFNSAVADDHTAAKAYAIATAANANATDYTKTWSQWNEGTAPSYFKGQILCDIGTAAMPDVSFFGDASTGTFSPAAGNWAVSTAGTERLRVTGTGDLLAATGYTPVNAQSLATKAYVDANSGAGTTTRSVLLTNPTRAAGRLTPPAGLKTQEDANIFFGEEIVKRSPVVVCTQAEYDGITPDPETLYIING